MLHFINMIKPISGGGQDIGTTIFNTNPQMASSLGKAPFAYGYSYSWATWIYYSNLFPDYPCQIPYIKLSLNQLNTSPFNMVGQKIFMSHTPLQNWQNTSVNVSHVGSTFITDRVEVKSFNIVYDDSQEGAWVEFYFDTPFIYNGVDSICIDWENRNGGFEYGGPRFNVSIVPYSVRYKRDDSNYPTGNCNLDDERPSIAIHFETI